MNMSVDAAATSADVAATAHRPRTPGLVASDEAALTAQAKAFLLQLGVGPGFRHCLVQAAHAGVQVRGLAFAFANFVASDKLNQYELCFKDK